MRRLFFLVFILLVLLGAGFYAWTFVWPAGPRTETFIEVPQGTSTRALAQQLVQAGVLANPYGFEALKIITGGSLKAGEYRFAHPMKVSEVYRQIARGEIYTVAVTIPEGANLFDVAARVQAAKLGTQVAFLAAAKANVALIKGIDPNAASLEGYLFPDTYRFGRHTPPAAMLHAMVRRFQVESAALGIGSDAHRVVTLASLVERETPITSERPLVASVFANRLQKGIPLETDPTVIYAALLDGRYRGAIYLSDLQADSAYNTYKHPGLPPGPICNPGAVSLQAALHPAHSDYLYFVAAGRDPHGHSRFAATLEEHQRNVREYRAAMRAAQTEP